MKLLTCFLTENDCYKRNAEAADSRYNTFQQRGPLGVMLHSTGANNPRLSRYVQPDIQGLLGENRYGNHWNRPGLSVCVHAFIGKGADGSLLACQTLPWNYRGWHCAGGSKGSGNDTHASIELCEDDLTDRAYFEACFQGAAELTARICREYGLDPLEEGVVLDHAEGYDAGIASNHGDVAHWFSRFGKTMEDFRKAVAKLLESPEEPGEEARLLALVDARIAAAFPVYQTPETVPSWARATVDRLTGAGVLRGDGQGLGLTHDMTRILVILDRLGLFDPEAT